LLSLRNINVDLDIELIFGQASNSFNTNKLNYYILDGLNINWDYAFNRFKNESTGQANDFKIMTASLNYTTSLNLSIEFK
jgi:hypothetical protein